MQVSSYKSSAEVAVRKMAAAMTDWSHVKVREGIGRTAVRPYINSIDMIFDMGMKRVTFWKNIL